MKDRARVFTTWALVALTILWTVGLDECLGLVDCCRAIESPAAASDTGSASGGCCATKAARDSETPASTVERAPRGERSGDGCSRKICACQGRSSAPAPVELVYTTTPSFQGVLPLPASRALSMDVPRSSPRSSIWSPLKARAPPGATGLS